MAETISSATVILILVLVGLVLFVFAGCNMTCGKKPEHFTRTPLSSDTTARFVRTPVDFAMKQPGTGEGAWQSNPHWMAFPGDEEQPLEFGPIDFYKDERKLAEGRMFEEFGHNYIGGTKEPHIVNDNKTRTLLTEIGNMTTRRVLDNIPAAGWPRDNLYPAQTDGTASRDISNALHDPKYGGRDYFWRDQVGP